MSSARVSPASQNEQPAGLSSAKLPLVQALRSIVDRLPKPNTRGELAWKKSSATGNTAIAELLKPENRVSDADHRKLIREVMPSYPLIAIPNPEIRAKKILSLNKGRLHKFPQVVKQVAEQFRIPEGQRVLFIGPEYFCRDVLKKDPKFQVKDSDGIVTGVIPCCPWCKSNTGVSFRTFECQNVQSTPRAGVHTDSTRLPLLGARYWCRSNECVGEIPFGECDDNGNVKMTDKDGGVKLYKSGRYEGEPMIWAREPQKTQEHSFVIWNKKCFEQFPADVKKVFSRFVFGLAHDYEGAEPNLLPTPELSLELLNTDNTFGSLTRHLQTHFEIQREHARQAYYEFVKHYGKHYAASSTFFAPASQPTSQPDVLWPDFDDAAFKKEMGPPVRTALENIFWLSFEMIQPYLERDLLSRLPGRILRWDGTYGAAKKMMNLDELDSIETLLLITGEYGDILSYAFAHDEGPCNWQILHYFLMKRCQGRGRKQLHDVQFGYDDLGSMNYSDPKKHWFATIWPAAKRGPLKDPLHAVMLVGRSTYAHQHPMNDFFARDLTACLLEFEKTSVNDAIAQLRSECPNTSIDVARHTVLTETAWKQKLYNKTATKSQQVRNVRAFWEKALKADADYQAEGHPPFLLKSTPTRRSTGCEIGQLLSHIERGDYQDPLPASKMSFVRRTACATNVKQTKSRRGGLENLCRLRGTNTVESTNKQINFSVNTASRLRKKLCDAKVQLKIHQHNLQKDRLFGRKTGRLAKDIFWLLQEANDLLAAEIDHLRRRVSLHYPSDKYKAEPLGLDFENYKKYLATVEVQYLEKVQGGKHPSHPPAFSLANPGGRQMMAAPAPTQGHDISMTPTPDPTPGTIATATPHTVETQAPAPAPTQGYDILQDPAPGPTQGPTPGCASAASIPTDTDNDDDFENFLNNFDVDAAIREVRGTPPQTSTPPRTRRRSTPSPSPSPPKKRRYQSGGATVYNRKEGGRSLMSPARMTVQQPLNVGQNERMARILTSITSNGTPKQITTASGTAKAVMDAWNLEEYNSNLNGALPMGILPIGVAESVVKDMLNMMVKARADGANMQLLLPKVVQDASTQPPTCPPAAKKKGGRPRKDVPSIPPIADLTDESIDTLSSTNLYRYLTHFNAIYNEKAPIPGGKKARKIDSLKQLKRKILSKSNDI